MGEGVERIVQGAAPFGAVRVPQGAGPGSAELRIFSSSVAQWEASAIAFCGRGRLTEGRASPGSHEYLAGEWEIATVFTHCLGIRQAPTHTDTNRRNVFNVKWLENAIRKIIANISTAK